MADLFEIAGRIHSTSQEEVVTVADEILDTAKNKKQDEINTETYSLVNDINERLSSLNPEQQGALSVAAKATNNETKLGYYVCGTEGNVAAKVISDATGYVLSTGGSIKVKMTNANTANNATLNINSTGAKPLYYDGERASANNTWEAGETVEVYYDGTNFYANNVAGSGGDGVFDVSEKYPTSGVEGGNTYTLDGALAVLNANLPARKKKGGMSIKFVQSSDNKYVQYFLTKDGWSANTEDWAIADEGVYIENPEFVYVKADKDDKILWAIKTDGSIYYGAGVPQQVVDYINERITELSLDEYEDIVAFLNNLEKGDKTLQTLLNEKVDKEEGKSLIDAEYASSQSTIDNPEFIEVTTDSEDKVLEGIQQDGTKVIGGGLNVGGSASISEDIRILGNMEVSGVSYKVIENPEYLAAWLDASGKVIFGLKTDGKTYVGDADFLNEIKNNQEAIGEIRTILGTISSTIESLDTDALSSITAVENPEYLKVELDAENKVLSGTKVDGSHYAYNMQSETIDAKVNKEEGKSLINEEVSESLSAIEDPEGRSEIITDSESKIISYRDADGVKHEDVGIESAAVKTNSLNLTDDGMTEFQKALKDSGFNPGGAGDYTDYLSNDGEVPLAIAEPRCAYINISGIDAMPVSKTADLQAYMEMYDYNGNYFKKKIIINAQGKSSLANPQKNFAVDMFDSEWDGDAFSLRIGNWVPQDSFHFKCFYYDPIRGLADVLFKFAENIIKATDTRPHRLAVDEGVASVYTDSGTMKFDYDTGALDHPDGFPAVVYLNGEFYGLFAWNLKKHRDNYLMDKKDYETIHIDSDTANLWSSDTLDWTLFEIRNPKTLICMDGSKYDGDNPKELIDSTSPNYNSSNKDHKNTVKTKNLINTLHTVVPAINAAGTDEEKKTLFEQYFDVDSFIVFFILSQVMDNYDGLWGRNTQWLYYKKSGKWCPSLYDLDSCMGYLANIPWLRNPQEYVLGDNTNLPYGLLWELYRDEIKAKYNELRSASLITSATLVNMVEEWCNRFGLFNIQRSIEKWNTPCYRDGKVNGDYWQLSGYNILSVVPENEKYDETKQYNAGDLVYFGVTGMYIMQYQCKQSCIGEIPAGKYDEEPYYGGCFDSPRRIRKWMDAKLNYLDTLMR